MLFTTLLRQRKRARREFVTYYVFSLLHRYYFVLLYCNLYLAVESS